MRPLGLALALVSLAGCASSDTTLPDETGDTIDTTIDTGVPGAICADGTWGAIGDPTGAILVRGGGTAGGDGSVDHPVATLAQALALIDAGAAPSIAIGPGSYTANLDFSTGAFSVRGCSAGETTITAADASLPTVALHVGNGDAFELEGVTLDHGHRGLVIDGSGGTVALDDVAITRATRVGLFASGANWLDFHNVDVVNPEPDDQGFGWGAAVVQATRLNWDTGRIDHANGFGVVLDRSPFNVDALVIDTTEALTDGTMGRGMHLQDTGGSITGGSILHSVDTGLFALRPLGVTVMGLVIDTTEAGFANTGDGMVFHDGSIPVPTGLRDAYLVTVQDSTVSNSARMGILLSGQILAILNNNTMGADGMNGAAETTGTGDIGGQNSAQVEGTDAGGYATMDSTQILDVNTTDVATDRL